jgi:hypothetical protein
LNQRIDTQSHPHPMEIKTLFQPLELIKQEHPSCKAKH